MLKALKVEVGVLKTEQLRQSYHLALPVNMLISHTKLFITHARVHAHTHMHTQTHRDTHPSTGRFTHGCRGWQ